MPIVEQMIWIKCVSKKLAIGKASLNRVCVGTIDEM